MIFDKNTLFIGKVIRQFEELTSTNAYAMDLITKSKPSEGTVISAYNQVAGKGQHDNKWESMAGLNLTLSIILYPTFLMPKHQFWLSQAIALGARDFVAAILPQKKVCIKWSNDIFVGDKKIGGILIQNSISGTSIMNTVVGLGLNINQPHFEFKGHRAATSLFLETQTVFNLDELREALFWYIESRYLQLKSNKIHLLQSDYMDVLYQYEQASWYELPNGERFVGVIQGIAQSGELVINREGELLSFGLKEVRFI